VRSRNVLSASLSVLALGLAAVTVSRCQLFLKLEDCARDSDCPPGLRCNVERHLCSVPPVELCNGLDDNHNGVPDSEEDFGRCRVAPQPGVRACLDGRLVCRDGSRLECVVQSEPAPTEICGNGVDDDCDGIVDNGADCMQAFPETRGLVIGSDSPEDGEGDDAPAHRVCLDGFSLDRFEVTLDAYATFLSSLDRSRLRVATPAQPLNPTVPYGQYLLYEENGESIPLLLMPATPTPLSIEQLPYAFAPREPASANLPVVNVTWFGAQRYCEWAGKHLPTEAEFFRAARGPDGTRPFPWGSEPATCERANVGRGGPDGGACVGAPLPVNSLPMGATPEGVFHLYGNVNEWMFDYLDTNPAHSRNNYYHSLPASSPDGGAPWCEAYPRGPLGPDAGSPIAQPEDAGLYCVQCRFARGRHYRTVDLRIGIRRWLDADRAEPYVGFRCAQGGAPR
jgi:formylglycine-generating enzyme required for sulfatase activity